MISEEVEEIFPDGRSKKRCDRFANIVGWMGSAAIVTAYTGTFEKLPDMLLNLGGSIGLFIICWHHKTYQSAVSSGVWTVVTLYKFFSS